MKKLCLAPALIVALLLAVPALLETVGGGSRRDWGSDAVPLSAHELARRLAAGQTVVFIDVREPREFEEFHIPGARSVPLRSVYDLDVSELKGADLVVPYCLKDFRGFEGVRALASRGLTNVAIVEGFGIKAWKRAGLPVAGTFPETTDTEALADLMKLVAEANP